MSSEEARAKLAQVFEKRQESDAQITIRRYAEKVRNPLTAIRAKCVECSGGSLKEVQDCLVSSCALTPFRLGKNPFNKKTRERMEREGLTAEVEDDEQDEDLPEEE